MVELAKAVPFRRGLNTIRASLTSALTMPKIGAVINNRAANTDCELSIAIETPDTIFG